MAGVNSQVVVPLSHGLWVGSGELVTDASDTSGRKSIRQVHVPPSHVVALIGEAVARVAEASVEEQLAEEREVHRMAAQASNGEYCGDPDGSSEPSDHAVPSSKTYDESRGCDPVPRGAWDDEWIRGLVKSTKPDDFFAGVVQTGKVPRLIQEIASA